MTDVWEVTCRPLWKRPLWFFVGLGAAGASLAAARVAYRGGLLDWLLDVWAGLGLLLTLVGIVSLRAVTAEVSADARGVHSRTLLRRRSVAWPDIADLRVRLKYANTPRAQDSRRIILVLRNGHKRLLPLPHSWSPHDPAFDAELETLRALHRRYGAPESSHLPVVSYRTAGRGWAGSLALCALLLAGAGAAAWFVPNAASDERAWKSATPCTAETPAAERGGECLATRSAVIARTEVNEGKGPSRLYFADGRPLERLEVSLEAAGEFQPGDSVELTIWRHQVREVAGAGHVWREHVPGPGSLAVVAAVLALAAGWPGARILLRLRGRRLPDDEVLPSALPFVCALVGTALWLLPLCYLHPTTLLASPSAITWAAVGSLVTLALLTWAWRATRIRTPGTAGAARASGAAGVPEVSAETEGEVFLAARFLDHTDYNPHGFGTHIVIGGGAPAVTPHPGPGRFAARPIPVERLTVKDVRRVRGSDGDTVPRSWHIAELDDAGRPVRLAAAPADLSRILRELSPAHAAPAPR
ncbi:PH domain-containing protein [Streptomyces sp. NPDC005970]|uniref:PH domain-containing protein n=1 Tax=Streptomyces sp. NPDC005970 TaxID=3156723 RepID=UPI0033CA4C75